MLLLALVAAMMLVASPVFAHPGGATHGDKYSKNYYPNGYYTYCEKGGDQYYGTTKAKKWCKQYYTEYKTKSYNGKKYYYVHVYYRWYNQGKQRWHRRDYWYYSQYHKYDDPDSNKPYFRAWVGYTPTGKYYWESFYRGTGGPGY
jgi:hypothetical protein